MKFYLLQKSDDAKPTATFDATGPSSWRNAISALAGSSRMIIAAEFHRPWVLMGDEDDQIPRAFKSATNLCTISTALGIAGAAETERVWPRVVIAIDRTAEYIRQLRSITDFATDFAEKRAQLTLVETDP